MDWSEVVSVRVACVLALHLPVQVERQNDPSPAGALLIIGGQPWDDGAVLDCCARAEAHGAIPGMRLARAEKLCPTAGRRPR
jgi:nucleotidyltransferase/DNA polymerase involved in DNA repair